MKRDRFDRKEDRLKKRNRGGGEGIEKQTNTQNKNKRKIKNKRSTGNLIFIPKVL